MLYLGQQYTCVWGLGLSKCHIMIIMLSLIFCTLFSFSSAQDIDLSSLTSSKGFRILGAEADDYSGWSVSGAGDVNGDYISDVIVGANLANPPNGDDGGVAYEIFGRNKAGGNSTFGDIQLTIGVAPLPTNVGFRILGAASGDQSGYSVSAAGDVNGDGVGDILVGAYMADPPIGATAGITYVIFGRSLANQISNPFGDIQLTTGATALSTSIGFRILGSAADDRSGGQVRGAGDINGDGVDDIMLSASLAETVTNFDARNGITYIIFGRSLAFQAVNPFGDIQLPVGSTPLAPAIGFRIVGFAGDLSGDAIGAAGDVNGDGIGDVVVTAAFSDPPNGNNAGISYVIFGRNLSAPGAVPFGDIQLTTGATSLASGVGFRILGAFAIDRSGSSASTAGDINGDGVDDIIIGANGADPVSRTAAGITYVIFGRSLTTQVATPFVDILLTTGATPLPANIGFRILGAAANDNSGPVSTAGDVNGDGVNDVIIGATGADPPSGSSAGISYVIFGRSVAAQAANPFGDIQLTTTALPTNIGFRILGAAADDRSGCSVSAAGDVNDDGIDDIIIGANRANPQSDKVDAGISYVIYGAYASPTSQPSSQPSKQPSCQPTQQPTVQPVSEPSSQPTSRPTQPTSQPTTQPTQPPTRQPSTQPTLQPSSQPAAVPSAQPFGQPSNQPSRRPSQQPSSLPSSQPCMRPTGQPSLQPSNQPSVQPSSLPSTQPSSQPSHTPSAQPTVQPSSQPSSQPSNRPRSQPTVQPSSQPRCAPTSQPSSQPSVNPSGRPSSQPTMQPSGKPSTQPSSQPSSQPSRQPSCHPSSQPTIRPSTQPSCQPSSLPSIQPSSQPSSKHSAQPSSHPSTQPSEQPSCQPSKHPTRQPSAQPTCQPSSYPSIQISTMPSAQPSSKPSSQPSESPSCQPSSLPSRVPTAQPSGQPSSLPTRRPNVFPTSQPSKDLFKGEWVTLLHGVDMLTRVAFDGEKIWACGVNTAGNFGTFCSSYDVTRGEQQATFSFRWTDITSILQTQIPSRVMVSGRTIRDNSLSTDVAACVAKNKQLACIGRSYEDSSIDAGAYVPFVEQYIYVGTTQSTYALVSVFDPRTNSARSFLYTSTKMSLITLLRVQSPPAFSGGFVAGTCTSASGVSYILAGMVRADTGVLTGIYLVPASGNILNSAELVNAMALEHLGPDSYIAGELQLSDSVGLQPYLVCVNSLYRRVIYGVRYKARVTTNRRVLGENYPATGSVKGKVLVAESLYLLVNFEQVESSHSSVSMLKVDRTSGNIVQQVQIISYNARIQCTDITTTALFLIITCAVDYHNSTSQAVVLSANHELAFSKLPEGFARQIEDTFLAERVGFKGLSLPLSVSSDTKRTSDYTFSTADGSPTLQPSVAAAISPSSQPSSAPSGRPSSSPTSSPSMSPQPTSQPSSSGPTNTYKPTVKPTQQPTLRPTVLPIPKPSTTPSNSPTMQPTLSPTVRPTTDPSAFPRSTLPTPTLTVKPTRHPTVRSTYTPTTKPSVTSTVQNTSQKARKKYVTGALNIVGYVVAGLFALWCVYQLWRWWMYKIQQVKEDNVRIMCMQAANLPAKSRLPIFTATAGLCCNFKLPMTVENRNESVDGTPSKPPLETVTQTANNSYTGQGANMDGPVGFVDLEANIQSNYEIDGNKSQKEQIALGTSNPKEESSSSQAEEFSAISDVTGSGDVSADESHHQSEDVDVALSEESKYSSEESYANNSHSDEDPVFSEESVNSSEMPVFSGSEPDAEPSDDGYVSNTASVDRSYSGSERSYEDHDWENDYLETSVIHSEASEGDARIE